MGPGRYPIHVVSPIDRLGAIHETRCPRHVGLFHGVVELNEIAEGTSCSADELRERFLRRSLDPPALAETRPKYSITFDHALAYIAGPGVAATFDSA